MRNPEGSVPVQRDRDFTVATIVAPSGLAEANADDAAAAQAAAVKAAAGAKGGKAPAKAAPAAKAGPKK